jgi:hypothetical protein
MVLKLFIHRVVQPSRGLYSPQVDQLSLFGGDVDGAPAVDVTFGGAQRIQLDEASWIDHVPGWLTGHEQLLAALLETAGWEQRDRWMYTRRVVEPRPAPAAA